MTITAVGTTKSANSSTGLKTLSFTTGAVGNSVVVAALVSYTSGTPVPTGISDTSSRITWQPMIGPSVNSTTPPNKSAKALFIGTVASVGTTTITIAYSVSITADAAEVCAQEFHSSTTGGAWSFDGTIAGLRAVAGAGVTTVAFPTLVPVGSGEVYFGYGQVQSTASATGITSGYTGTVTTTFGDIIIYNPNVSTSQSPVCTQTTAANAYHTVAALVQYTIPPQTVTLASPTVAATAFALTRNKTLPMSVAQMVNAVAYQLAVLKALVLGSPSVTATAYAMTVSKGPVAITVVLASPALAASAYAMSWVHTYPPLPSLTVAASAHPLGVSKSRTLDHLVVAATAYPMTLAKLKTLTSPTVAATAYAMTVAKAVVLASPAVASTAYVMHPSSPNNVHLDSPTCHATAYPMGVNKRYPPFTMHWWFHARGQHVPHWSEEQEKS